MAATFEWGQDTGTQTGTPTKGTTRTVPASNVNYKNSGVIGDAYSSFPIQVGSNSFENWQFGKFTGTFNSVSNLKFAHTAGVCGTGVTVKGPPACTGDGSRLLYTTPSAAANANLSNDMTSVIAIGSGVAVAVGATGPEATGKASSGTANPLYTNFLTTQLQTLNTASPGDIPSLTFTLSYDEN